LTAANVKALRAFWAWFVDNEDDLAELLQDDGDDFAAQIHPRIRKATELNWEAGGDDEFALCPRTRAELEEAEQFVAAAPELKRWRVSAARPPKKELTFFNLRDFRFDVRPWIYRLMAFEDRRLFEVQVWTEGARAPRDEVGKAARLAVALALGDRAFVQVIDRVTIFAERPAQSALPFEHLRPHLASVAHPDIVPLLRP
jgi:hypothetical protein